MVKNIIKWLTFFIINNKLRRKTRIKLKTLIYGYHVYTKAKSIGKGLCIGNWSSVNKNTLLGEGVNFNGLKIVGEGNVKIGNYFHCGEECMIITQNHDYDHGNAIPYSEKEYVYKDVVIQDFVWLGSRVMLLPGTKIGEGAIVQGGAVVHGEVPPFAIVGGNPSKIFKYRDKEHFEKLKQLGKFY